jgi:hypothetical protein
MTFTVAGNSFKDSDYLPSDFILSSDFGFGWAGRNRSPHLKWSGAPVCSAMTADSNRSSSLSLRCAIRKSAGRTCREGTALGDPIGSKGCE